MEIQWKIQQRICLCQKNLHAIVHFQSNTSAYPLQSRTHGFEQVNAAITFCTSIPGKRGSSIDLLSAYLDSTVCFISLSRHRGCIFKQAKFVSCLFLTYSGLG